MKLKGVVKMGKWLIVPLVLVGLMFVGCDDSDDDDSSSGNGLSGRWSGGGNYDQGTVISDITLDITDTNGDITGTYSVTRTGRQTMTGTVAGDVNGGNVDLRMTPHGSAAGSVDGNTMSLYWYEDGFGGTGGGGNVVLTR